MDSSSSSLLKAFAAIAVLFLFFSTGFSRELMRSTMSSDTFATPPSLFQESVGNVREMIEMDYEEAGPNTNTRSGFILPQAPAPLP